ncbi:cyclic beta-1,2-glucan synthetase [Roseiarcus fermentans]|uniref:Cyclic beta-1,2-glucan synthetase n=1 Tax=Roseiarcus fermentans TaxID=1473586 RepID=A0A366EQC6_9HYPH|nr:glycosyl transferase family 36 [Roseiarcus fermentans]RBP04571.1 cyclic beta-1,2-glucan synthetase [Roseiarcus fermentans]
MDMTPAVDERRSARVWSALVGAALVAVGIYCAAAWSQALPAAVAGAGGLALLRRARAERPYSHALIAVDALAFAAFALLRNDGLGFWQLPGPWLDVLRFNLPSATIALLLYSAASAMALIAGFRGLRVVEALSLIAIPFLFNLLVVVGADWHMAEIGALVTFHAALPFPVEVAIGRGLTLWLLGEAMLALIVVVSLNHPPRSLRVVALFALSGAYAAVTPLIANAAQLVATPVISIVFSSLCAALAQGGLWAAVYLMTGVALDWLAGRPPRWDAAWDHWRTGVVKGAIYGALFMAFILIAALVLRIPGATGFMGAFALLVGPALGAALFPLAKTVVGSADGTPPFFGRLRAAYLDRRSWVRGAVAGLGLGLAYAFDLAASDGGARFLAMAAVGALAYAGVDIGFDLYAVRAGARTRLQSWRLYALGAGLGALVAGALGWYFDSAQLQVVIAKFWAYADVNYRQSGRQLGDFVTYPIFNKYGSINLGEVAGGVRLFWAESVAGVINWSLAAPLFSINYVLLDALLQRSLRPIKGLVSPKGVEGVVAQGVRVLRWGLWMAPIINSFLRQAHDPSWYNQDGAVRTAVVIGADATQTPEAFRRFSLVLFLGLLAYDWLRILIWFDHMGLRVASLVNLSFLGGDRADEAAARFVGHNARTRAIPDGIRRFGTWAPLLIPFYIPRGAEWDFAWTGAEKLARGGPMPEPIRTLGLAYAGALALFAVGAGAVIVRAGRNTGKPAPWLASAPRELARNPRSYVFTNGAVGVEMFRDGRGAAFVMGAERGGGGIDLIRRPLDPLQARGHFFYVSEEGEAPWSIGFEPCRRAGDYSIEEPGFHRLVVAHALNGIEARMEIAPDAGQAAILSWKIRLTDRSGKGRRLRLTSFCEIAGHETEAYARDLDFAGMHVETIFVRALNAILARNRLLRSARADRGETAFFAVKPGANAELVGYEDSRTRFLGEGSLSRPTGCEPWRWRKLDDEGKLWTFDPAASFTVETTLDANGSAEVEFIMGRSDNAVWASDLIAARLGLPPIARRDLETRVYETRAVEPTHALPSRWPFAISDDGRRLELTHRTPRPWAHVMANELGMSTMASNDGEIFSAFANARQNGLSAFRFDSATVVQPGQVIYLRDLDAQETDSPVFVPFQRADATYRVAYEPGVATFLKTRGDMTMEMVVFAPPDRPCDVRILTLRNDGDGVKRLRIVPFFDIALEESPNESVGKIRDETVGATLVFQNRSNDFERGFAFAATSLDGAATETVRTRFFGGPGRDIHTPAMVETGAPDGAAPDDGRRVAAFCGEIAIAPKGEAKLVVVFGQARSRDEALAAARRVSVAEAEADLAATRASWAARLGKVEIRTNRPDFDRLVNTWLPYQLYASRLWGRVGPNQRGGATGFRDQLQDVLPLALIEPRLTRAQIVLHASQQFLEGDVLKWWHRAPNGGTGLGQRTKASDPHLWLPYVLARYVRETGDASVLDEVTPFLEADAVPDDQETWIVIPRASRETATVYEHARLAIRFTLAHLGENGLPLLRAGDWNDGIDVLGRLEIGTSVWMGFFLASVLDGFAPLARGRGDEAFAVVCEEALAGQRAAVDVGWRGDHYALDFADDGEALDQPNAMTSGWAAWSGACDDARALAALEGGLKGVERPDRVLLLETPFYEHSRPYPGRIADYPPGVRENGGQYSHGASWIVDGFVRLAINARARGEADRAAALFARAFEIFEKISPLKKTDPESLAVYGLVPIQQPADIYDGWGHGGRGGWSWYTGSAARMLSAAWSMLGLVETSGEPGVRDDLFEAKGPIRVESIRIGDRTWRRDTAG